MTLLMTGGTGFLGLHLVREHLLAGRHVTVLAPSGGVHPRERVERFLSADGSADRLPARLRDMLAVVEVDITHHSLGLSPLRQRALAAHATELWHVATATVSSGQDGEVWRTGGTENVLRFAACLHPAAPLRHVSTAFVGGRTREGIFREQHSAEVAEFENSYERCNHLSEGLVRRWANRHGRSALVLRPSILVPAPLTATALPEHPLRTIGGIVADTVAQTPFRSPRLALRVFADPRGFLNLLQAGWAARAMLRLGERVTASGTHIVHVVHPTDTPLRTITRALEDVLPVRLRLNPDEPVDPTMAERALYSRGAGFLPYLHHRRRFDGSALRGHGVELPPPAPIERPHLRAVLRAGLTAGLAAA